jgi:excisionase family DNA binding protein
MREILTAAGHFWQAVAVTESTDLLTPAEVADQLGVPPKRVQQMLRDHALAAVSDGSGNRRIPADFLVLAEGGRAEVVKGLSGVLTLLADAGYTEAEAVRWLFDPDESLPGTPIAAMRAGRGTEVKRRAQALGF